MKVLFALIAAIALGMMGGCNTVEGVGKYVKATGMQSRRRSTKTGPNSAGVSRDRNGRRTFAVPARARVHGITRTYGFFAHGRHPVRRAPQWAPATPNATRRSFDRRRPTANRA